MTVTFYNQNDIPDEQLTIAVIAARYNGRWVFCRHRSRTTWEIPGGHREKGETILEAAKRELYEETGAVEFDITPVCVYGFTLYGMLYYADIKVKGEIPDGSEIAKTALFRTLPQNLTYPHIQNDLFRYTQGWLNLQNSPDELWDVYDEFRLPSGKTHRRGTPLAHGEYHLVVDVWIADSAGNILLTLRAPDKGYGNLWECTGGSALAGEDSLTAALREVREETGIILEPANGELFMSQKRSDSFRDIWLFRQDFDPAAVVCQAGETCGARSVKADGIRVLREEGLLIPVSYLDELLEII